jgi:hypothetical protein
VSREAGQSAFLVVAHKAAVAGYVSRKDRSQPAIGEHFNHG